MRRATSWPSSRDQATASTAPACLWPSSWESLQAHSACLLSFSTSQCLHHNNWPPLFPQALPVDSRFLGTMSWQSSPLPAEGPILVLNCWLGTCLHCETDGWGCAFVHYFVQIWCIHLCMHILKYQYWQCFHFVLPIWVIGSPQCSEGAHALEI